MTRAINDCWLDQSEMWTKQTMCRNTSSRALCDTVCVLSIAVVLCCSGVQKDVNKTKCMARSESFIEVIFTHNSSHSCYIAVFFPKIRQYTPLTSYICYVVSSMFAGHKYMSIHLPIHCWSPGILLTRKTKNNASMLMKMTCAYIYSYPLTFVHSFLSYDFQQSFLVSLTHHSILMDDLLYTCSLPFFPWLQLRAYKSMSV